MTVVEPNTINSLGWAYQTGYLNNTKPKASFLRTLMFGDGSRDIILPAETVELSYREGDRMLAPFVEVNSEALSVGARSTVFANVSTPNIRIKRPMDAYQMLVRRQPNTGIFVQDSSAALAARTRAINEDMDYMSELIENREEWMVGQLLGGFTTGFMELSYATDIANFRLRIPRSNDMTVQLLTTARWTDAASDPWDEFMGAKRVFSRHVNSPVAAVIMDSVAATLFIKHAKVQAVLDRKSIDAGSLLLQNQFQESGAIYHGVFAGVPVWEYGREYVDDTNTARHFLGGGLASAAPGRAYFIAGGQALRDNEFYYGAIPDHDAAEEGLLATKRFSKSWKTKDPSAYTQLVHTRPLPFIRRPNGIYIVDVN